MKGILKSGNSEEEGFIYLFYFFRGESYIVVLASILRSSLELKDQLKPGLVLKINSSLGTPVGLISKFDVGRVAL